MNFLYPAAFAGLIFIPVIVLLYMLKKQYTKIEVSSLFLWQKMLLASHAKKPWQKFKKNILMVIEILCLIFLVFALASPVVKRKSESGSYLIVADNSYTMSGKGKDKSKFEQSIENICDFIDSTDKNAVFTVITAEKNPEILVSYSENKWDIKEKLKNLDVSYSTVDRDKIVNLLNTFSEDSYDEIIVFSDKKLFGENEKIKYVFIEGAANNLALVYMNHSINEAGVQPFVRVRNSSAEIEHAEIALYGDHMLLDIVAVDIEPGSEKEVFFGTISKDITNITAKILNDDSLEIDNVYYDTVNKQEQKNAVLFTEGNIFLENALSLREDFDIYRGNIDDINEVSGYFLYIFDSVMPDIVPDDGHLLFINPSVDDSVVTGEKEYGGGLQSLNSGYLNIAENLDFSLSKYKLIEDLPSNATVLLSDDSHPLIFAGEKENQKYTVLTFDLFDSDLPLKKEFPIFIYELMNWYSDQAGSGSLNIKTGDIPAFTLKPDTRKIAVEYPDGSYLEKEIPYIHGEIKSFNTPGHYKLTQIGNDSENISWFSVNIDFQSDGCEELASWDFQSDVEIYKTNNINYIFILLALAAVLADWYIYRGFKVYRPDFLRSALILIIMLTLISPHIHFRSRELDIIFAADVSDSLGAGGDKIRKDLENLTLEDEKHISAGLVAFGGNASVENDISSDNGFRFNSYIDKTSTDISNALMLSASLFSGRGAKKIVLISDGNDTLSNALSYGNQLKEQGISLDILPVENQVQNEVQLTQINVPGNVSLDMAFNVEIIIDTLEDTQGQLHLYRDNVLVQNKTIDLKKGTNNFIFSDICSAGGHVAYKAEILCSEDYYYQNNKAYAYTYIEDMPSVLVIGCDGSADAVRDILESMPLYMSYTEPYGLSSHIQQMNKYDLIIMSDISYETLPEGFGESLKAYVGSGGGLIVLGGENSYALGWYNNTPLEEILPVDMELKDQSQKPDLALVMVIDRSGSMESGRYGMTKIELAKEAVKEGIKGLLPGDSVGVLAFDSQPVWVVETAELSSISQIEEKISSISPGGGTSILPALEKAAESAVAVDSAYKHMILLTDGMAETSGYDDVIAKLNRSNITLSTVAVGTDSDVRLLESLAEAAGGRYYYTDEFTDLPRIFLKETLLSGGSHLNHETFYPQAGSSSSILESIEEVPALHGFVHTTLKARGEAVLNVKEDIPLLAVWQYGLGRSSAFTSDLKGMWSSDFLLAPEGVRIFRNTVSWTLRNQNESAYIADASAGTLYFRMTDYEGLSDMKAQAVWEGGEIQVPMKTHSPGVYTGDISSLEEGIYYIHVQGQKNDETVSYSSILQMPYSREYDITLWSQGHFALEALARAAEGNFIESLEEAFYFPKEVGTAKLDTGPLLLILAIGILIGDIAYRRIGKKPFFFHKISGRVKEAFIDKTEKDYGENTIINQQKDRQEGIESEALIEKKVSTADQLLNNKRIRKK